MSPSSSNVPTPNGQRNVTKDKVTTLRDTGSQVVATVAAMQEVAIRIEAAVLEFENKKLEVLAAIELQRTAAVHQILSERHTSLNQIAAARDGAIKAIKDAQGNGTYRPPQHYQPTQ